VARIARHARRPWHALAVLLFLAAGSAHAEERDDFTVTKLTDHIYKLGYDVGYVVNLVASVGEDGILLVDTGEKERAEALRRAVRTLGAEAPRFIINTHAHVDHTGGNAAFGSGPVIVAQERVRARLRSGSYLFDEFPDEALPDVSFADSLRLWFNGEEIRVLAFPGAHDDNDAIVWFTGSKVVAAGDLVYANGFPSVEEVTGNVLGYLEVLPRIRDALPPDVTIVCGHSEDGDRATVEEFRRAVSETAAIVEREWKRGRSADDMRRAQVLRDWTGFARGYVSIDEWIGELVDAYSAGDAPAKTLYEPMYYSLRDRGVPAALATYDDLKKNHRGEYRFVESDLAFMADKLARNGRLPEAVALWGLFDREYPESGIGWYGDYSLGKLYETAGDRERAVASFRRALERSPGNPRVLEHLKRLNAE
jgi:cyclase